MIIFNKPYITTNEINNIKDTIISRKFCGNGIYTKYVTNFLEDFHESKNSKFLLTTSCTDALEMSALLLDIKEGDEVILPSYTFVSTALAFEMRGAKLVFADSESHRPHINFLSVEKLITPKTKAIIVVHYAGQSADLDPFLALSQIHSIPIIEDNAQGITSKWRGKSLGTIGEIGTLSFHESKNIHCGEGGALIVNKTSLFERAEILLEKGTNRAAFNKGTVDKYSWVDLGSSYLLSDILAAFLMAQLSNIDIIQSKRLSIYNKYMEDLSCLKKQNILIPFGYERWQDNGHIFYIVARNKDERDKYIDFMRDNQIYCVSHYQSLHKSPYYINKYTGEELVNSDRFSDCLVRLPLYPDLTEEEQVYIIAKTKAFFGA